MPFLCNIKGEKVLFFCKGEKCTSVFGNPYTYRSWSIHYCYMKDTSKHYRIDTGFEDKDIECNPSVCMYRGKIVLSFVASKVTKGQSVKYDMYHMTGDSLSTLNVIGKVDLLDHTLFNGALTTRYRVFGRLHKLTILDMSNKKVTRITTGFDEILRVAVHNSTNHIFNITARVGDAYRSYLYNVDNLELIGEILADGESVYKCTMLMNDLIYAKRVENGDHENRELHITNKHSIESRPFNFSTKYKSWENPFTVNPILNTPILDLIQRLPNDTMNNCFLKGLAESLKEV